MKNNIPDQLIVNVLKKVAAGEIDPNAKRYIFGMTDGRFIGFDATNENEAREQAEAKGFNVDHLANVEREQFHGLTMLEIQAEAKKRNLGDF